MLIFLDINFSDFLKGSEHYENRFQKGRAGQTIGFIEKKKNHSERGTSLDR